MVKSVGGGGFVVEVDVEVLKTSLLLLLAKVEKVEGDDEESSGSSSKFDWIEETVVKVMFPCPPMYTGCRNVIRENRPCNPI